MPRISYFGSKIGHIIFISVTKPLRMTGERAWSSCRPISWRYFSNERRSDLRVGDLDLDASPRVRLHGKGDKWRTCPLWEQTTKLLKTLLGQKPINNAPEDAVFLSQNGRPLTRFGIYKIVRRHTDSLPQDKKAVNPRRISPHVFRHTAAVHLLESGVEVNVIRNWLGDVSLETTNRYAEINTRMKEAALRVCEPKNDSSMGYPRKPICRDDETLLSWLDSLWKLCSQNPLLLALSCRDSPFMAT